MSFKTSFDNNISNNSNNIIIRFCCLCVSGEILLEMGRFQEAQVVYTELVMRNPENWAYYTGLENAIQPSTPCLLVEVFNVLYLVRHYHVMDFRLLALCFTNEKR